MKAGRGLILAALALFVIAAIPVFAQDVPLGDLARKNKKETKSKKVITNEDIPESASANSGSGALAASGTGGSAAASSSAPQDAQAPAAEQAAPASASPGSAAAEEEDPVDVEIQQIQTELDALKKEAGVGVRSIQKLEEQLKDPNLSEARRRTYEDILASGIDKVGSLENQITQKEQALQQAQDKKKAKEAAARRPAAAAAPK